MKISLFRSYQTLSDLCEPKNHRESFPTSLNSWRDCLPSPAGVDGWGKLASVVQKTLSLSTHTVVSRKIDGSFSSSLSDGWMADGSFKIWITQFKVIVVYVLNYKHQQRVKGGFFVRELRRIASRSCLLRDESLTSWRSNEEDLIRKRNGSSANNSDWWIISPASLARFNCVEGIILKSIIFNFHRKFFATLIPDTRKRRITKTKKKMVMEAAKTFSASLAFCFCLCYEVFPSFERKKVRNSWHRSVR